MIDYLLYQETSAFLLEFFLYYPKIFSLSREEEKNYMPKLSQADRKKKADR